MFYGSGCSSIDQGVLGNILQSISHGSSDKVKMTFEYRFSNYYQNLDPSKYSHVKRFTLDENADAKDKFSGTDTKTMNINNNLQLWNQYVKAHDFAGTDYIMASDTALSSFITWSKQQYPKATKTILIINDHGGGWSLIKDGTYDNDAYPTRHMLTDDTRIGANEYLSLGDVVNAISKAGKVDILYDDACLMSMWENLTGYSTVADIFVGSQEVTTGSGGNYYYLLDRLQNSTVSTDGAKTALQSYTDDVVDKWWPLSEQYFNEKSYNDIGVYDLRQIATPLNVVANASKLLVQKWDDATFKPVIRNALTHCEMATNTVGDSVFAVRLIPQPMLDYFNAQGYKTEKDKWGIEGYKSKYVLKGLKFADMGTVENPQYIEQYRNLWQAIASSAFDCYCLADFLHVLNDSLTAAGVSSVDNPFIAVSASYIAALQNFCYLRCTHPLSDARSKELGIANYVYDTCSPSVFIYPFDAETYSTDDGWGMCYHKVNRLETVAKAIKVYNNTIFDQKTSWGTFLQKVDVVPNVILNPCREEIK